MSDTVDVLSTLLHPLLGTFQTVKTAEIPDPADSALDPSGAFRVFEVSHLWTVSVQDIVDFDVDGFLADLFALADNVGEQKARHFIDLLSETAEAHGQTVDAEGRGFYEVLEEALNTIDMAFDEDGNPQLTVIVGPGQIAKMRDNPPSIEQERRAKVIIDRRREEWLASRGRPTLP